MYAYIYISDDIDIKKMQNSMRKYSIRHDLKWLQISEQQNFNARYMYLQGKFTLYLTNILYYMYTY